MTLHETLKEQLKEALKAKDEVRLRTIRGVLSALTNELVSMGKKPQEMADDETAIKVITRLAKQRKDSIEQFKHGGRQDLADIEEAELKVLETYLPTMMSQDAIRTIAKAKQAELGITDKAKAGQLVGMLMKDLKGKADGGDVKAVVDSLFA